MASYDVVVIGGGIVGACVTERLARAGKSVALVEQGEMGREASWAAAGLLTPVHPWNYPEAMLDLDDASFAMWPDLAERIRRETGVDVELRRTGLLSLIETDEDEAEADYRVDWKRQRGEEVRRLSAEEAREEEPALTEDVRGALLFPALSQVRNHRVAPALAVAAAARGAEVMEHTAVLSLLKENDRIVGVVTSAGRLGAGHVVVCAGAWSSSFMPRKDPWTIPARGQILLLRARPGALRHMLLAGGDYLVPRADGRILVGSTVEYVGFDRSITASGLRSIGAAVERLTPSLAGVHVERTWAGLRPDTADHMPLIGDVRPGLIAATGLFRSGIMLAPITAEIVLELVDGHCARDLTEFHPARFG